MKATPVRTYRDDRNLSILKGKIHQAENYQGTDGTVDGQFGCGYAVL